jgi:hypothetical protein
MRLQLVVRSLRLVRPERLAKGRVEKRSRGPFVEDQPDALTWGTTPDCAPGQIGVSLRQCRHGDELGANGDARTLGGASTQDRRAGQHTGWKSNGRRRRAVGGRR